MKPGLCTFFVLALLSTLTVTSIAAADIVVGDRSVGCADDPACINRLHPDIPMIAKADPGERIVFLGRDAFDLTLDADEFSSAKAMPRRASALFTR